MLKKANKYLRFLSNLFLFIVLLLIFDQLFGNILHHCYFKYISGTNYQTAYAMDSTEAEIIILGSSRAKHVYIPGVIEDSLHMTCYNCGQSGNYLLYSYAVFSSQIERYQPKIVILDLDPMDDIKYNRMTLLLPYYESKPNIRIILNANDPLEKYKLISKIYPFNSTISDIFSGIFLYQEKKADSLKGYQPLYGVMDNDSIVKVNQEIYDNYKISILIKMATICKKRNIELFMIQSPRYELVDSNHLNNQIKEIAIGNNAKYYNCINENIFMDNSLFRDPAHLNNKGAVLFTSFIVNKIKNSTQKRSDIH